MTGDDRLQRPTHPTFIVTCAAGREGEARRELRALLGRLDARPLFMKGNLLVAVPEGDTDALLAALREAETQTIGRVVPVAVQAAISREPASLAVLADAALAAIAFVPGDTFRIECKRRGDHAFRSTDVQREVGLYIEGHTPAEFRFDEPDYLVPIEIYQDLAFVGCIRREDAIHKTITRMRIYAPGERPLNRAEKKLREALHAFGLQVGPGTRALDLGAAPGGWTKVLGEAGAEVLAVDPADLDPEVASLPTVTHFRGHAQQVLELPDVGRFHLITNDMNRDAEESANTVVPLIALLRPMGAVIMTVKFMTRRRREHVQAALSVLAPHFEEHRHKRLPHNAKETTLFLQRPTTPLDAPRSEP